MHQSLRTSFAWLVISSLSIAHAGDLDANQRKVLASLTSYVSQIETNVKLAEEAAGPGEGRPPEAKIRLVRTRLAQPQSMLPQVRQELAKLPADHADVTALRGRLDAADATIARLEARIGGTPPAPTTAGTKLDYKQEKALSDGDFYVRQVVGMAAALEQVVKDVGQVADKDRIDHRQIQSAMATIDLAGKRAALARGYLDPLPADGAGVKPALDQLATALASVAVSQKALEPIHARLRALVDPATYPTLEFDVKRMQQLAAMYRDAERTFDGEPARAAKLVAEAGAAREEFVRYAKAYGPLAWQQTEEGRRAEGVGKYFEESHVAFVRVAEQRKQALPAAVVAAIVDVNKMADTAVAEQKPAFFSGGIPNRVAAVQELVDLLTALDANAGKTAQQQLEEARAGLKKKQAGLRQGIIDANESPPNAYEGGDRALLEQQAVAAWKKAQTAAKILGARIPSATWHRETMWRRQNSTWYLIDRSRLQVQLLVEQDADLAVIRPIDLWIDHAAGDARSAIPLDDPGAEVEPQRLLRRHRIK